MSKRTLPLDPDDPLTLGAQFPKPKKPLVKPDDEESPLATEGVITREPPDNGPSADVHPDVGDRGPGY